jgi:hypothetical protein
VPWTCTESQEIPTNIVIAITPMIASVSAAFFSCGRRNAGTPLEMASTPVRAVAPDEKARRITNRPIAFAVVAALLIGSTASVVGQPPRHWTNPSTIRTRIETTKPYVGTANRVPDSRAPRRFAIVTNQTKKIDRTTLCSLAGGYADPIANTPATIDTITVIM